MLVTLPRRKAKILPPPIGSFLHYAAAFDLVLAALEMAVRRRQPRAAIDHSDQRSLYTSAAFSDSCRQAGVRPSMGSVGDAYDNAMCKSFFATLECELLDRTRLRTPEEAEMAVFEFVEGW